MTAEEYYQRGQTLQSSGNIAEAVACFDSAIALRQDFVEAYCSRANALFDLGLFRKALADYDQTIALRPDLAALYYNRANTLAMLRRFDEATKDYDKAIKAEPKSAKFHAMRAAALERLGREREAITDYAQAIALQPNYAEAHYGLGYCLARCGNMQGAQDSLRRAILFKPDFIEALVDYAKVLVELGCPDRALHLFSKAAAVRPDYPGLRAMLLSTRMKLCDWQDFETSCTELLTHVTEGKTSCAPFSILAMPSTPEQQLACARRHIQDYFQVSTTLPAQNRRGSRENIRIAYLSGAFGQHPTTFLMTDIIALHDRSKFEVVGIAYNPHDGSAARTGMAAKFDIFIDASQKDDRAIAEIVRELKIDIAVDLDGFIQGSRMSVMAQRPAPIQVAYLGYPATLGANYMDYLIADRVVIPHESERYFTEKIVALPGSYQANSQRPKSTHIPTRQKHGLPDDGFVFCCFNNNYKITPDVFSIWMRLLLAVPGSVLWLIDMNPIARANLRREAEKCGVAGARLIFAPFMDRGDHLVRHQLADLFLDTFHYNAHTTGTDALWAGLPVLTCRGESFASRVGASLLSALGLEDLITHSPAAYESMAVALATDPGRLAAVKERLWTSRETSPLFDAKKIAGNLDKAFDAMWQIYMRGDPPASFVVTPAT